MCICELGWEGGVVAMAENKEKASRITNKQNCYHGDQFTAYQFKEAENGFLLFHWWLIFTYCRLLHGAVN